MHTLLEVFAADFRLVGNFASRSLCDVEHNVREETEDSLVNKIRISKIGFVLAAGASFLFSVYLWFSGSKDEGVFVGLWVPSILSFGTLLLGRNSNDK